MTKKNVAEASLQQARGIVEASAGEIEKSSAIGDERVAGLLEDVQGQCSEAISSMHHWKKWGRHYTPSVMFAHKLQQCNNFKDPGVQFYGGSVFKDLQNIADAAFDGLPAPKVTPAIYRYLGDGKVIKNPMYVAPGGYSGSSAAPAAPAASMAAYNDRFAGCIDGSCFAALACGERRRISELTKGDRVAASGGKTAEVVCVVRTQCTSGRAAFVELLGAARVTPYHPVKISGQWQFPIDTGVVQEFACDAVYTFVLQGAVDLLVGDVPCIALGHELQEGAAMHPYLGSKEVLKDIEASLMYGSGVVELLEGAIRHPQTGLVCGLAFTP